MKTTIEWINETIDELVDPSIKLKNTLLKVQVLAYRIKNEKLDNWIKSEINGHEVEMELIYRKIPTVVFGNLFQQSGFSVIRRQNQLLPIENLKNSELRERLKYVKIINSVSELESMIEKGNELQNHLNHHICQQFTNILANSWEVDSAWQKISLNSLEGILNSIKSKLLSFLLQLATELGEEDKIDIMKKKNEIDNLFDKTIGQINSDNVNISFGSNNLQTISTGKNASINANKGDFNTQINSLEFSKQINELINDLRTKNEDLGLSMEDKEDLDNEIKRIETQVTRTNIKYKVVSDALGIIKGILIGVTGNVLTQPIIEKVTWLMEQIKV